MSTINDIKQMEKTKRCPYCGEEILESAIKCKHCGEWLEKKDSGKMPVNRKISNWFKDHFWQTVIPIIAIGCFLGVKHYLLYKKNHSSHEVFNGWKQLDDAIKSDEVQAFHLLTKSPWYCKYTINNTLEEDGWTYQMTMTIDSKKTYAKDNSYTEEGTLAMNVFASNSDYVWEADGTMEWQEEGEITDFYVGQSITEQIKSFNGDIVEIKINRNTIGDYDDEIIAQVRDKLTEIKREIQEANESTYHIKTLTEKTLELEGGTILEPTGEILIYNRE